MSENQLPIEKPIIISESEKAEIKKEISGLELYNNQIMEYQKSIQDISTELSILMARMQFATYDLMIEAVRATCPPGSIKKVCELYSDPRPEKAIELIVKLQKLQMEQPKPPADLIGQAFDAGIEAAPKVLDDLKNEIKVDGENTKKAKELGLI